MVDREESFYPAYGRNGNQTEEGASFTMITQGGISSLVKTVFIFLGIATVMTFVLFQDDILKHPTVMRKISYWSPWTGFKRLYSESTTPTYGSTSTDVPLTVLKNFRKYYALGDVHSKRKRTVERMCDKHKHGYLGDSKDQDVAHNLHVDQSHHLVYCQVQKVGSTFIRKILRKVEESSQNADERWPGLKRLSQLKTIGFTELHSALMNSFKFMFTREPYSRLLSGYVDKLFTVNTMYWRATGTYIRNTLQNGPRTKCGHDITFPEFVKYIIQSESTGEHTDRHFTPVYEHCRPCQIPYDFIGKMETFSSDIQILLDAWNERYDINVSFANFEAETGESRAISHAGRLYSMRNGIEKCTSFYLAMKRVWKDLQIRSLLSKNAPFPFKESESDSVTQTQFTEALEYAIITFSTDREALRSQRKEALVQAYSQVPVKDLIKLREIVRPDCELFGYDVSPPYIFNRTDELDAKDQFQYFDTDNK